MPTIRIDEDVWSYLKSKATPFEDTPNDVLRRELKIVTAQSRQAAENPTSNSGTVPVTTDKDYSYFPIKGFRFNGKLVSCRSFADMMTTLSGFMFLQHRDSFEQIALQLHGKKRSYFSRKAADLRKPHKLPGGDIFVETNLSANNVVAISRMLVQRLGYDRQSLIVE